MIKPGQFTHKHVLLIILLGFAMVFLYLAGTISVEARWFAQEEDRATTSQIAAVSAAVSLLLMDEDDGISIFLPLIVQ